LKRLFADLTTPPTFDANDRKSVSLFRHVSWELIEIIRNQYRAAHGKETNKYKDEKKHPEEKIQDRVARLVQEGIPATAVDDLNVDTSPTDIQKVTFLTIIVDEAHFCRNVLAYWGLGLAILGTQSRRTIMLTGTPYNNRPSDVTALMTYIDPSHDASRLDWWEDAVGPPSHKRGGVYQPDMVGVVSEWHKAYLLRRTKEVLLLKLPPRRKTIINIAAIPSEIWNYRDCEENFLKTFGQLRWMLGMNPDDSYRERKVFQMMMTCLSCMRMALVHPVLPGGREMTINFSPSRKHLLKREERPNKCVFCRTDPTKKLEDNKAKNSAEPRQFFDSDDFMDLVGSTETEMDLDDDKLSDNDAEAHYKANGGRERELQEREKGRMVPLGAGFCKASGSQCQHFAHEEW
jgi:hypothetical protein